VAVLVAAVLFALLAGLQNLSPYMGERTPERGRPPSGGEMAKLMLLLEHAFKGAGLPGEAFGASAAASYAGLDHPADRLQGAIVTGAASGPEAALRWIEAMRRGAVGQDLILAANRSSDEPEPPEDPDWASVTDTDGAQTDDEAVRDAEALERLYTRGPGALDAEEAERLRDRYGWLGELALADQDRRAALMADAPWAVALVVFMIALLLVWGLAGLGMFIAAIVLLATRRLARRFVPPQPGGSVYLETFGVFLAGFALVQVLGFILASIMPQRAGGLAGLGLQWLLLVVVLWPVARGVSLGRWRRSVGLTAPRGVWREVGAGVAGYFAGVPLLVAGIGLTLGLNALASKLFGERAVVSENPVLELVQGADVLAILLLVSLATVWAPVAEEIVFRGALYRHVRARRGVVVSGLATALLFAFMHGYGPLMVGPLIALGFTFAMIREWRGSLIGPIVAHALHNTTAICATLLLVRAVG
jgi:membrane protease YdiL (CAAX protease family)